MKNVLVIYHGVDYDGLFSASIAISAISNKYPDALIEKLPFNYGNNLPKRDYISAFDTIVMTDVSFPPEVMKEISIEVNNFIWIDHHITAIDDSIEFEYANLAGIRCTDNAATLLTWKYFYPDLKVPEIIRLISTYDIWDNSNKGEWENKILPLQLSLRVHYEMQLGNIYNAFFTEDPNSIDLRPFFKEGKLIQTFQRNQWKSAIRRFSFEIKIDGRFKGICMISTEFSSNMFHSVKEKYDIYCIVNRIGDGSYQLSLYLEPDRLVGKFSAGKYLKTAYGGGGHRGAAGCIIDEETFHLLINEKIL